MERSEIEERARVRVKCGEPRSCQCPHVTSRVAGRDTPTARVLVCEVVDGDVDVDVDVES